MKLIIAVTASHVRMPTSSARVIDSATEWMRSAALRYSTRLISIDSSPGTATNTQVRIPTSPAKSRMTTSSMPAPSQVQMANSSIAKIETGIGRVQFQWRRRAVASISIFMRASTSPHTSAVAAGRAAPRCSPKIGASCSNSAASTRK